MIERSTGPTHTPYRQLYGHSEAAFTTRWWAERGGMLRVMRAIREAQRDGASDHERGFLLVSTAKPGKVGSHNRLTRRDTLSSARFGSPPSIDKRAREGGLLSRLVM